MLQKELLFVDKVRKIIESNILEKKTLRKDVIEKIAKTFDINDQTHAKELTEYAVVQLSRSIALGGGSIETKYSKIVGVYDAQPNLTHRSSQSTIYQQYSTPAPISYLAGAWCLANIENNNPYVFEPSAGNGLFVSAFPPNNVWVNEIDTFRKSILENDNYKNITSLDSSIPKNFENYNKTFDIVITNPPFDKLSKDVVFNGTEFGILDHLMVAIALETLKNNGKAAIIIGGHTEYDNFGRIKAGKNRKFISYLYKHYDVEDIINIDGSLYKKQGTQFNIRMILISGRKPKTEKIEYPPLFQDMDENKKQIVQSFDELFSRIFWQTFQQKQTETENMNILELEAEALLVMQNQELELDNNLGATPKYKLFPVHVNVLNGVDVPDLLPEIKVTFKKSTAKIIQDNFKIKDSESISILLKKLWSRNTIEYVEKFMCIFLAQDNTLLGWTNISIGSKKATIVDVSQIVAISSKINCAGVILAHNHPSGNRLPSKADSNITEKLTEALRLINVLILDHIIITKESYYSFADNGQIKYDSLGELSSEKFYINYKGTMRPAYVTNWHVGSKNYQDLVEVIVYYGKGLKTKIKILKDELKRQNINGLGMPYIPVSDSCNSMNVDVPDSMAYETQSALLKMKDAVGGNVVDYVAKKLNYTDANLCKHLFAEQIDAVANAIYNMEEKGQGIIIGDQTGIGKGRQAAAIIRYGIENGIVPVFITEKPNLFSDMLRDMIDIESQQYKPFIVNGKDGKTDMKDKEGVVIYSALDKANQDAIFKDFNKVSSYDYVVSTYSQFNKNKVDENGLMELDVKGNFLLNISENSILILDESHNAGGDSNTGRFLKKCVANSKGTIFLSATFAKRPENMPLYAIKTSLQDCNMSDEDFIEAFKKGGVALQEVVSSQLVQEGQMIRRERKIENLEVNYITLTDQAIEHASIADKITAIMRRVIKFEENYIDGVIENENKIIAATQGSAEKTKGTSKAGVSNSPYFSKIFNVINQMLFSIKTNEVIEHALIRLKEGKKVVIAFSSTMGAFLDDVEIGEVINADFGEVLERGLKNVLRYSEIDSEGKSIPKYFSLSSLSEAAQNEYFDIMKDIKNASTGITVSPIDVLKQRLSDAGYNVIEVTGRKKELRYNFSETEVTEIQEKQAAKPKKKTKSKGGVLNFPNAELIMPPLQYSSVINLAQSSEEKDYFIKQLEGIEEVGELLKKRSLEKETNAWKKENKNVNKSYSKDVAIPSFHFFNGSTDIYIYEWDKANNQFYTYTILNGDTQNAEFGWMEISDLHAKYGFGKNFELDFTFPSKPINEILKSSKFNGLGATASTQKNTMALVLSRDVEKVNDAFRKFQDNECDVLLINQSGSTGASAHAIPTSKVLAKDVKQRCMIFLQAELDINRQVQKMGRVNRTGQILIPIYDYLSSVIPAEQRLMMMLQKKLKSLDANTSSNQKNSSNLLDVPDFLNKYGDKVVYDYLINNKEINLLLGDVLEMGENEEEAKEPSLEKLSNLSSKVSGRVAVLSVVHQEHFYQTILEDYAKLVRSLKQQGKYDLEMETKNFESETLSSDIVYVNPEPGRSVFANHSFMEKCEVNNLIKPYSKYEVTEMVELALGGKTNDIYQAEIIDQLNIWADKKRETIVVETTLKFNNAIENITTEKAYLKLISQDATQLELEDYIEYRTEKLEEAKEQRIKTEHEKVSAQTGTFRRAFKFFYPGRSVSFPTTTFESGAAFSKAIFINFDIDYNKKNPFTPGNIYLSFAIADSNRHYDVNLANEGANQIGLCISQSYDVKADYIEDWTELCSRSNANRVIRYIITGNILQAISKATYDNGKLVNYTVKGGGVSKGLIMPNNWQPNFEMTGGKNAANIQIAVPVYMAKDWIKSNASRNNLLSTSEVIIFDRYYDDKFTITVPKSKTQGGTYFQDKELLKFTIGENFNSSGNFMFARLYESDIDAALKHLQDKYKLNVMMKKSDLDTIEIPKGMDIEIQKPLIKEIVDASPNIMIVQPNNNKPAPSKDNDNDNDDLFMLELEAEALIVIQEQELAMKALNGEYHNELKYDKYNEAIDLIDNELKKQNYTTNYRISKSENDFGMSWYMIFENNLEIRISDHSVTSTSRILDTKYVAMLIYPNFFKFKSPRQIVNILIEEKKIYEKRKEDLIGKQAGEKAIREYILKKSKRFIEKLKKDGKTIHINNSTRQRRKEVEANNPDWEFIFFPQEAPGGSTKMWYVKKSNWYGDYEIPPIYFNYLVEIGEIKADKV